MKTEDIVALRPCDGSSTEIKAALNRAEAMRDNVSANLAALVAQGAGILLAGSAKEMADQDRAVRQARESLEQVEGMVTAMQTMFVDATRREKIAAYREEYAALNIEENAAAFVKFWHETYPGLARKMAAGLELEAKAAASMDRAWRISARLEELGEPGLNIPGPTYAAVGAMSENRMLSDLVRLPGVGGAPFVGAEYYYENVPEVREVVDYDNPILPPDPKLYSLHGGAPMLGVSYRTKRIETTRRERRFRPARQDVPIWPTTIAGWAADQR